MKVGEEIFGETFSGQVVSIDDKRKLAVLRNRSDGEVTVNFETWEIVGASSTAAVVTPSPEWEEK